MSGSAGGRPVTGKYQIDLSTWPKPFVSARQLAGYMDVVPRTIVRMIRDGALPGVKVGRSWRIPTDDARKAFSVETRAS